MKRLLLLFLLLNTGIAFCQTVKLNLDSVVAVDLPGKPLIRRNDSSQAIVFKKYSGEYIIVVQNFNKRKNFKLSKDSLSAYYQGVIQGNLILLKHFTLLNNRDVNVDGFKAIDFEYKADSTKGLPDIRYQRAIFLNNYMITFCYWTFSDSLQVNLARKDAFFKSVTVIADKSKTKQYTDDGFAEFISGHNGVAFLAIAICVVILVMFVIKKLVYKRVKR